MIFGYLREQRSLIKNKIPASCSRHYYGVTKKKRLQKIIISLTTYPGRIKTVHKTIITLLKQTTKPDYIVLWLAEEQFPHRESELPKKLMKLRKHGLDIKWCHDIRSYKKLIPALTMYPDDIIITVDDDWYYRKNMVEELIKEHNKYPEDIITNGFTHPYFDKEGRIRTSENIEEFKGTSGFMNKILGSDGVLYLSKFLDARVFDESVFMHIAPTNDDIWFWAMAVKNGTKIRVPENPVHPFAMTAPEIQRANSLDSINSSQNLYIETTNKIFEFYPEIKERLLQAEE